MMFEYEREKLEKGTNGDFMFGLIVSFIFASVIMLMMFLIVFLITK